MLFALRVTLCCMTCAEGKVKVFSQIFSDSLREFLSMADTFKTHCLKMFIKKHQNVIHFKWLLLNHTHMYAHQKGRKNRGVL